MCQLMEWLRTGVPPRPASAESAVELATAARAQRVAPLLHVAIETKGEGWPEPIRRELREAYHQGFSNGVVQLELAARAERLLEQAGLRCLPLKGAAVAERLYESVAERPMADVDLIALDDFAASVETLRKAGFEAGPRADHAWAFSDPVTGGSLELHHSFCSCPGLFPVDADGLWRRRESGSGQVGRRPSSADLLVQLSLHAAFQNGLGLSLLQYLDLRRLMERAPPEPEVLVEVARHARAAPAVIAAVEAARVTTGCPRLPGEAERVLGAALGGGFQSWLRERLGQPEGLLASGPRSLGRARWELSAGRRGALLVATLAPRDPGAPAWSCRRLARALGRGTRLAWSRVSSGSRASPGAGP